MWRMRSTAISLFACLLSSSPSIIVVVVHATTTKPHDWSKGAAPEYGDAAWVAEAVQFGNPEQPAPCTTCDARVVALRPISPGIPGSNKSFKNSTKNYASAFEQVLTEQNETAEVFMSRAAALSPPMPWLALALCKVTE